MLSGPGYKQQFKILMALSNTVILGYSLMLLAAPSLQYQHSVQRAIQHYNEHTAAKQPSRDGEYILHAAIFNVLICLFGLSSIILQSVMKWKLTNFCGLFTSLLLLASNWVIPMSLLNFMSLSQKVTLPENFLIFRLCSFSVHGNQVEFLNFMRLAMLFGFLGCLGASVVNIAYWKERFMSSMKASIKNQYTLAPNNEQRASR